MECQFCRINKEKKYLMDNELAYALLDNYPVSDGHTLIISKRHVETFFDLTDQEIQAFHDLALKVKKYLDEKYHPIGYNVGFNCGAAAGQTVMHCHMHIIPRYEGDCDNPRGGVRKILHHHKVNY
ncbi:MAG: HIT family protein [Bacilli bacterium]